MLRYERFHPLEYIVSAGSLVAALCLSSSADVISVRPEDSSKHFAAVSKHLELGGLFFTYIDIDGDMAKLAAIGDRFIDIARKDLPAIPKELSASRIVDALGLTCVKAIGMSSRRLDGDLYHNRALLYMPDGPKGLLKLFGGKAEALQIPSFAPADAGLAIQMDVSLGALLETVEAVMKAAGDDTLPGQFKAAMSFPVPGLNISAGEFVAKLNPRVMIVMRIDDSKKLSIPGAPVRIPAVELMIALDHVDFVMQPMLAMLGENDAAEVEQGDGFTIIRPSSSLPGDLGYFKPGLYHDQKHKRIIFTSHIAMAQAAGTGDSLAGSEAFKKATAGLPTEGNGLSYMTPEFIRQFLDFYTGLMKETMKAGGAQSRMDEMVNLIFDLFPAPAVPVAGIHANVPEGMLFMSNMNENHKHTLAAAAALPVAFIGGIVAGYQSTMQKKPAAPEPPRQFQRPAEPAEGKEAPSKTVKDNLEQIAFAAQTYFIDNPKAKEVTYEALVRAELIFDLDAIAGESYKGLTLNRTGGELSVKLKSGDPVTFKYQAAGN